MKRWVKIYHQLLDWEHFTEPTVLAVWMYLLLSAEHKTRSVRGRRVTCGEVQTSYREMSAVTGLSHNTVKAAIDKLTATGEIKVDASISGTRIMILKFSTFQGFPVADIDTEGVSTTDTPTDTQVDTQTDTNPKKGVSIGVSTSDTPTDTPHIDTLYYSKYSSIGNKNIRKKDSDTNVSGGSKKKSEEKKEKAVTRFDHVFEEIFRQLTGDAFIWTKRENVAVNTIVGKIAKMMEEGGADSGNADLKEENLRIFLTMLYERGDTWIRTNFVPHVIADKFTEYYQRIKNYSDGKPNKNNPTGVSADYLASVARDLDGGI